MKHLILGCLAFIFIFQEWGCKSDTKTAAAEERGSAQQVISPDSLRQVYLARIKPAAERLPEQQIKEEGKLYPVDEGPRDTGFFVFREWLLDAVRGKDVLYLMSVVDPQIKCSFGEDNGTAAFVKQWGLDVPAKSGNSEIWAVLEQILTGGGVFENQGKSFTAPYLFATFPEQLDGIDYGAITGSGVRLRSQPDLGSEIVQTISYDIVKVLEETPQKDTIGGDAFPWYKVRMNSGKEGYVFGKFFGRPIGYRAAFEQKPNKTWMMTLLIAGD